MSKSIRINSSLTDSKSGIRERRTCTQRKTIEPDDFYRVLVKRDEKLNLGWIITSTIQKNSDYRHERHFVYLDGGESDWFETCDLANVEEIWPNMGIDSAYSNETLSQERRHFNYLQMKCLETRRRIENDAIYDFLEPDHSVGQVLLLDENTPVQVVGVTDFGGFNIQIKNLKDGWKCWFPFFSINFLHNREMYQKISEERNLFKDFKPIRSQNCLDLRPKIFMPSKTHPSMLGNWDPLHHQLNLIDQTQPLEEEVVEITTELGEKRIYGNDYDQAESTAKMSKMTIADDDVSSGIGSNDSNYSNKEIIISDPE